MQSQQRRLNRQQGMTSIGWLFVIALIGFFALLILKLVPVFMERYEVINAVEGIAKEEEAYKYKKREIRRKFNARLNLATAVDNVSSDNLDITRNDDGSITLHVKYEAKKHFAGPFYVMAIFETEATIPSGPSN